MRRTKTICLPVLFLLGCGAPGGAPVEEQSSEQLIAAPAGVPVERVVSGLANPTAMEFAPDGRLFVCEQSGSLRIIDDGKLLVTPFVKVTTDSTNERGLLGVAFDPSFASNQFVYVYYTATTPRAHNRVSRFTASGDVAVIGSELVLVELDDLSAATNHNGGALHFGDDGKLYIAVGENANGANAQTLNNRLGKLLRVDADGSIPTDNPFFSRASGQNRAIWAMGLRNPFTFAFQPSSGRMFINDVGQSTWEEIDDGVAGANYGWPTVEGRAGRAGLEDPVAQYGHGSSSTTGCAITGGTFYEPATPGLPSSLFGGYFFADACSGWIRRLDPATRAITDFARGLGAPTDLKTGADGALYVITRGDGSVWRFGGTGSPDVPAINVDPDSVHVSTGKTATFTVEASGAAPLSFVWSRGGAVIPGATSAKLTLSHVARSDDGARFSAVVSNAFGSVGSQTAELRVSDIPAVAKLSHDVRPILEAQCSGCHIGNSFGGLSFARGHTHASLVGAHSVCNPHVVRVVAGSPSHSLLWQKIHGDPSCGSAMPPGSGGLKSYAPHDFDVIDAWIAQGAKDN